MSFRIVLDGAEKGAKFESKEEAKTTLWELYKDKMSEDEFNKFIDQHLKEV